MFTPLLFVSLETDLLLFGFSPWHFYMHQLIALILASVATYVVFRLWFPLWIAFTGSVVVLLGVPVASMAQQLMLRHYIEGWLLAALAMAAFVAAVRRQSWPLASISAVLYFGSALAKEIFVPLMLILIVLPERSWRERARFLILHVFVLITYTAWRWIILGTFGGGYGWNTYQSELPVVLAALPGRLTELMFPAVWGIVLVVIVAVGILPVLTSRHAARVLVAVAVSLAPIVPVAKSVEPRYAFALWVTLIGSSFAGYFMFRRRTMLPLAIVAVLVATVAVHRLFWNRTFAVAGRMSVEGRALMKMGGSDAIRNPAIPPAAMGELQWMKTFVLRRPATPFFYDDIFLCTPRPEIQRMFEYAPQSHGLRDVTAQMDCQKNLACAASLAPLYAEFHYEDDVLAWEFGPYETGTYRVIIADGLQAFVVPRRDSFQLAATVLEVRVRYDSPEGWRTYSDPIALDFSSRPRERWERGKG